MNHFEFVYQQIFVLEKDKSKLFLEAIKLHGKKILCVYGGGSVIDASKHIACSACYKGDPWELMMDRSLMTKALPVFVVLTISATGSEMNPGAVITNEETHEKLEISSPMLYPTVSICDPAYTMTLPASQTAGGCADIDSLCSLRFAGSKKIMKFVQISCGLLR